MPRYVAVAGDEKCQHEWEIRCTSMLTGILYLHCVKCGRTDKNNRHFDSVFAVISMDPRYAVALPPQLIGKVTVSVNTVDKN